MTSSQTSLIPRKRKTTPLPFWPGLYSPRHLLLLLPGISVAHQSLLPPAWFCWMCANAQQPRRSLASCCSGGAQVPPAPAPPASSGRANWGNAPFHLSSRAGSVHTDCCLPGQEVKEGSLTSSLLSGNAVRGPLFPGSASSSVPTGLLHLSVFPPPWTTPS